MILEKCDVCGQEFADRHNLITLYRWYQSDTIKDVCGDCQKQISITINKVETAMLPIKTHWVKQIIQKMVKGE